MNSKSKSSFDNQNVTEAFTRFELSGVTGIIYKLSNYFDIGIRYSHGLTEMTNDLKWIKEDNQIIIMKNYSQYLQIFLKWELTNFKK